MNKMADFSLSDKFTKTEGTIILSGIQALIRLALDQHRADKQQQLNTATFIAGYRGSPLGSIDMELERNQKLLEEFHVNFVPGVNEDLSATAVGGSQIANLMPNPKYDGVLGMWYGKGPGVDRSGDAFKHANYIGVGKYGGVLALAGDDPSAKSSTIPSHSEIALYDAFMPVLFPGNVQEILDLGRLGFELSRYCGLWVGFKIVTNVADEFSTAQVSPERIQITQPNFEYQGKRWSPTQNVNLLAPYSLQLEREIIYGRLEAAKHFARENNFNQIVVNPNSAKLGIISSGKTYYDLRQALNELGLDEDALHQYGIRILKLGMIFPLEKQIISEFADGLDEILVIEEKRAFIEMFLREALYDLPNHPKIVGKTDEEGLPLVRGDFELDADTIVQILEKRLKKYVPQEIFQVRLQPPINAPIPISASASRSPYFCSGCPHNRSTVPPDENAIVAGGIGCHTLAILMDRNIFGVTQMGGEGAQWVGASPFTDIEHIFQNIGDGTLFHSGSLAIRQAIAENVNVTYKILYNTAVAMTGGQHADGAMTVPNLTRELEAEGVKKIIVVSADPHSYAPDARWANNVDVWHRDRLQEAQRVLQETYGVTALIYDQECAAQLRRKRKRGYVADPTLRVFINEAICEGCGDCGVKSNCLSVFPVETEFGRKTQIHQSSCNKDYTCLEGDCPAFVTVIPDNIPKQKPEPLIQIEDNLPEPDNKIRGDCNILLMGIGGTGVVTINQIMATAALIDNKYVTSLDQTGLSQKGGPVVSNLKILDTPRAISNKIGHGQADAYIAFDLLTATAPKNIKRANPQKTVALVSTSKVPTGKMVSSPKIEYPHEQRLIDVIESQTQADKNIYVDALGLSEALFHSHMPANIMMIGVAYQAGLISISAEAIEQAVQLNGVAVDMNIQAFRVGRKVVIEPEWASTIETKRQGTIEIKPIITPEAQTILQTINADGELQRLLEIRVPELIAYQNPAYAQQYVDFVRQVQQAEQTANIKETQLSEAVARYLFKLMAYKDEYEVARLALKSETQQALRDQFGENATVHYKIHPPILRSMGMKKKLSLGKWFNPMFGLLTRMKRLRGTPFDIFGYTEVRRTERALIEEYRSLITDLLANLTPENYETAVQIAQTPDMIRGYEDIKLRNVKQFWEEISTLQAKMREITVPN